MMNRLGNIGITAAILVLPLAISIASVMNLTYAIILFGMLPFVSLWIRDSNNKALLVMIMASLFLVPFQQYGFIQNSKFFLFPGILLIQLFFFKMMIEQKQWIRFTLLDFFFFTFFSASIVSTLNAAVNINWSLKFLYVFLCGGYMLYYSLKLLAIRIPSLHLRLLSILNTVTIIAAIYGLIEYVLKENLLYGSVASFIEMDTYRAASTLDHPLVAGLLYNLLFPYNLARVFTHPNQHRHKLFCLLLLLGIISTGSRGSLLVLLIGVTLWFLLVMLFGKMTSRMGIILFLSSVLLLPAAYIGRDALSRFLSLLETGVLADPNRYYSFLWALDMFKRHWLWGLGPFNGDAAKVFNTFGTGGKYRFSEQWGLENAWASLLLDHGLIGTIPFVMMVFFTFFKLFQGIAQLKKAGNPYVLIPISLAVGFISFLLNMGTFNATAHFNVISLFWLVIFLCERYASSPGPEATYD